MGSRDGSEVLVAQFQLNGARVQVRFPQAPPHHLGEPHQSRLKLVSIGRVFVISMFVADRFRFGVGADFGIEPSAGILSARFACQRQSPFAEPFFEFVLPQPRQVPHFLNAQLVQMALHHFANAGNRPHIERRQELRFFSRHNP